jgi:hypothetical protein
MGLTVSATTPSSGGLTWNASLGATSYNTHRDGDEVWVGPGASATAAHDTIVEAQAAKRLWDRLAAIAIGATAMFVKL